MLSTVLDALIIAINKTDKNPYSHGEEKQRRKISNTFCG